MSKSLLGMFVLRGFVKRRKLSKPGNQFVQISIGEPIHVICAVVKTPATPIGKNLGPSMMVMLIASLLSTVTMADATCFRGTGAFNPRLVIFVDYPGLTKEMILSKIRSRIQATHAWRATGGTDFRFSSTVHHATNVPNPRNSVNLLTNGDSWMQPLHR